MSRAVNEQPFDGNLKTPKKENGEEKERKGGREGAEEAEENPNFDRLIVRLTDWEEAEEEEG